MENHKDLNDIQGGLLNFSHENNSILTLDVHQFYGHHHKLVDSYRTFLQCFFYLDFYLLNRSLDLNINV